MYLTRGEAGIKNGDRYTASKLRTAEALRACGLLGARALFANQIDGHTSAEKKQARQFTTLLASLKPDIVFTH